MVVCAVCLCDVSGDPCPGCTPPLARWMLEMGTTPFPSFIVTNWRNLFIFVRPTIPFFHCLIQLKRKSRFAWGNSIFFIFLLKASVTWLPKYALQQSQLSNYPSIHPLVCKVTGMVGEIQVTPWTGCQSSEGDMEAHKTNSHLHRHSHLSPFSIAVCWASTSVAQLTPVWPDCVHIGTSGTWMWTRT